MNRKENREMKRKKRNLQGIINPAEEKEKKTPNQKTEK